MIAPEFEVAEDKAILSRVYEGMRVYDRRGSKIGSVEYVYLGDVHEAIAAGGREAAPGGHHLSLIAEYARDVALPERVADPLREQLLRQGFLKITGTGLFGADRYVLPSQIGDVSAGRVTLRVSRRELAKP
jgi:hypothetical protein